MVSGRLTIRSSRRAALAQSVECHDLAALFRVTNRFTDAEILVRRALEIDEQRLGKDHPDVATSLNNLAHVFAVSNRLAEAEPLFRRVVEILLNSSRAAGHPRRNLQNAVSNYAGFLKKIGRNPEDTLATLRALAPELFQAQ